MTAASICFNFINHAAKIVEMLINIDTSVTVILRYIIKYQFKTYSLMHILSGNATNSASFRQRHMLMFSSLLCVLQWCRLCVLPHSPLSQETAVATLPQLCILLCKICGFLMTSSASSLLPLCWFLPFDYVVITGGIKTVSFPFCLNRC